MSHTVVQAAAATNRHDDTHHEIKEELPTNDTPTPTPPAPPSSSSLQRRRPKPLSIPTLSSATAAASSYSSSASTLEESSSSEPEDLQWLVQAPPFWKNNNKRRLSKQVSMCETPRDRAWEKRRRQIIRQESRRRRTQSSDDSTTDDITDEDLHELKACIELGFGFNEEEGQRLCNTLPALDLYFAVHRGLSPSPVSTPRSDQASSTGGGGSIGGQPSSLDSPRSTDDSWKICCPGDNPQQVKTKLRHWAQAVACSVMQSSS